MMHWAGVKLNYNNDQLTKQAVFQAHYLEQCGTTMMSVFVGVRRIFSLENLIELEEN